MAASRDRAGECASGGALTPREYADILLIGFGARWEQIKMDFGLAAHSERRRKELRRIETLADDFSLLCNPGDVSTEDRNEVFPLARCFLKCNRDLLSGL